MSRSERILVTGAHGGLGSAVVSCLRERYSDLILPTRAHLNLLDGDAVLSFIAANRPDKVIHLAATVFGLKGNIENNLKSLIDNTAINNNLFSALSRFPPNFIFFAGTVASYPYPYPEMPLREDFFFQDIPHWGEYGYASAKRYAKCYLDILKSSFDVDYTYGVFTNMYGAGDRFDDSHGHVVPSLIKRAYATKFFLKSDTLKVWGSPDTTRDFIQFSDGAAAISHIISMDAHPPLINISSGVAVTMYEVARTIADFFEIEHLDFDDAMPVGIPNRYVSNQKLLDIGFNFYGDLKSGLYAACQWYSDNSLIAR